MQLARERGREVEAEAVHVHLLDPVPQRIHQELQRVWLPHVQRVPGARVVHVVPGIVRRRAVVRGVVDALERKHRPHLVAFGGVVVDDVEEHLDAGAMQRLDHRLELLDLPAALAAAGVLVVRGEEPDGIVPPVVAEPLVEQMLGMDELVDGQELDGGDPEHLQMLDGRRRGHPGIFAPLILGDLRVPLGESLDVDLVDHRVVPGMAESPVVAPVEVRVRDYAARHEWGAVRATRRQVVLVQLVRIDGLVPLRVALDGAGIGIEQELGCIAA